MPRSRYVLALCSALFATACGEVKCPSGYTKYGDQCRRCPPGEERERGQCVAILDGSVEEITGPEGGRAPLDGDDLDPDEEGPNGPEDESNGSASDANTEITDGGIDAGRGMQGGDGQVTAHAADAAPEEQKDSGTCSPGTSCQQECPPSFCMHQGSCELSPTGPTCDCVGTGYRGAHCESDVDECAEANACSSPDYPCVQTQAPGYTCQGQFADWPMPDAITGSKVKPDYDITTTPGVVIDKRTGLLWQRTLPATQFSAESAYAGCTGMRVTAGDSCSWSEAKAYCQNLVLAGSSEWRLPSKIELESISDHSRSNPAIDPVFPNTPNASFWTNSHVDARPSDAWSIFAGNGASTGVLPPATASVRCVRSVATSGMPASRYQIDASSDSVTDARTGLVWQRSTSATKQTWTDASSYCQARGTGWRLPSLKELLTLVDPSQKLPAIDTSAFPSTPKSDNYWSATPAVNASPFVAWYVAFDEGASSMTTNNELWVRCVR